MRARFVNDILNEELSTMEKLIKTAERDGHITGLEGGAQYIMDAAKEIAKEWDKLHPEQKKVFRDSYYKKFLEKIKKL